MTQEHVERVTIFTFGLRCAQQILRYMCMLLYAALRRGTISKNMSRADGPREVRELVFRDLSITISIKVQNLVEIIGIQQCF